jgi:hypothetical protein
LKKLLISYLLLSLLTQCQPATNATSKSANTKLKTDTIQLKVAKVDEQIEQLPSSSPADNRPYQSKFEAVCKNSTQINYALKKFEIIDKSDNFLTNKIDRLNKLRSRSNKKLIPTIDISEVQKIRKAFIKGTKDMGNSLYPRADLEAWELSNEAAAIRLFNAVKAIEAAAHWEAISKSPITFFKKNKEVVFITPGGFYMLDKVPIIEKYLKDNM